MGTTRQQQKGVSGYIVEHIDPEYSEWRKAVEVEDMSLLKTVPDGDASIN